MKNKLFKNKNLIINIIAAYSIKGISLLVGMFLVRAYLRYFSNHSILGVWYTILSIINWIIHFDMGIGQGLRNYSVKALQKNNFEHMKKIISSAYVAITTFAVIVLTILSIFIFSIDWNRFFNLDRMLISNNILRISVLISVLGIVLQMILKLVVSIFNALGKTAIPNFLTLCTNLIIVIFITMYKSSNDNESLMVLSIVYFIATTFPYLLTTIVLFNNQWKMFKPNFKCFDRKIAKGVMGLSSKFFIVQVFLMGITATNELYITRLVDVSQVVDYQFYYKIFGTILLFFSLTTNPVWSTISKAWVQNNVLEVKRYYRFLLIISGLFALGTLICFFMLQNIFDFWLGNGVVSVNVKNALIFLFYTFVMLLLYAHSATANALSLLNEQILGYLFASILKIPTSIILLQYNYEWGSIVLANALLLIPYICIQPISIRKKLSVVET